MGWKPLLIYILESPFGTIWFVPYSSTYLLIMLCISIIRPVPYGSVLLIDQPMRCIITCPCHVVRPWTCVVSYDDSYHMLSVACGTTSHGSVTCSFMCHMSVFWLYITWLKYHVTVLETCIMCWFTSHDCSVHYSFNTPPHSRQCLMKSASE